MNRYYQLDRSIVLNAGLDTIELPGVGRFSREGYYVIGSIRIDGIFVSTNSPAGLAE